MPRRCIVPGCMIRQYCRTRQYKGEEYKCEERVQFFSVPKDPEVAKLWQAAIRPVDIELSSKHFVCEKHFSKQDVLTYQELKSVDGTVLGISPYERPRLKQNAVPTLFPWTELSELQTSLKAKNSEDSDLTSTAIACDGVDDDVQKTEEIIIAEEIETEPNGLASSLTETENVEEIGAVLEENLQTIMVEDSTNSDATTHPATAYEVWNLLEDDSLSIPKFWTQQKLLHNEMELMCFSITICKNVDGHMTILPMKEIIVHPNMKIEVRALGKDIETSPLGIAHSVGDRESIQHALDTINRLNICCGYTLTKNVQLVNTRTIYKDNIGKWRHNQCTLLSPLIQCKFCQRIEHSISRQQRRQEIARKVKKSKKRIVIRRSNLTAEQKAAVKRLQKRKAKLQHAKQQLARQNKSLRGELKDCQLKMARLSKDSLPQMIKAGNIPKNHATVIQEIIAASKCKSSRGRRYSESWMILCLLLHMRSPASYNFLKENEFLPLPSIRCIRRNLAMLESKCGFDPAFFKLLEKFFHSKEEIQRHGVLLLDEMSTRESILLNSSTLTYTGLEDFGEDQKSTNLSEKANHALVFMFRPMYDSYTQPIAVFASRGPTTGVVLAQLIIKAITLIEKAGGRIHGVVSDNAAPNRRFWTEMGVNGKRRSARTSLTHPLDPKRKVFIFSDTPHLIKNIRNRLYNNSELQMDPQSPLIRWKDFEVLFEKDRNLPGKLRVCPKITVNHIHLNSSAKMRVKLATQIFSRSMARGLRFYKYFIPELHESEQTAEFCEWVNDLFDALNQTSPAHGLTPQSHECEVIKSALEKLDAWEKKVDDGILLEKYFLTKPTAQGLRVTLHSMLAITTYLTNKDLPYVLSGNINQDALERFFGRARQAGGCNDHPSTPTFLQIYRILSMFGILKPPKTGNCSVNDQPSDQDPLCSLTELKRIYMQNKQSTANLLHSLKTKIRNHIRHEDWSFEDEICQLQEHDYSLPDIFDCVLFYVVEYLCNRLTKVTECEICKNALTGNSSINQASLLSDISNSDERIHPNHRFVSIIKKLEAIYQKHCNSNYVFEQVVTEAIDNELLSFPCEEHCDEVLSHTIIYYLTIRMRKYATQSNNETVKINQLKKKQSKFCNT